MTTESPRAFSGLGSFFLLNLINFQYQTKPLLLKNEKVYTPASATISPLLLIIQKYKGLKANYNAVI
jgi:hypothetical protein